MARGRNMGKNEKLSRKEKQELKKEGEKMRNQIRTIVVPSIGEFKSLKFISFEKFSA